MTNRRLVAALPVACALAMTHGLNAQAIQRALYVSALTDTGAPVADLASSARTTSPARC
jgi:hypothetical protein